MNRRLLWIIPLVLVALLTNAAGTTAQEPAQATVGTSFTYQGRLLEGANPANGSYDFQFKLFDAISGNPVGNPIIREDVVVSAGLFSLPLDFGEIFTGQALVLEIGVRPGDSTGDFTTLAPRQPLTPAPYALAMPGVYTKQAAPPFVGVGRTTSITAREFFGVSAPVTSSYGGMFVETTGSSAAPFYGYATAGTARAWHYYDGATGSWILDNQGSRLVVRANGDVGIGIETPAYRLDLVGDRIRLRSSEGALAKSIELRVDGNAVDLNATNADLFLNSNTGNTIIQPFGRNVGVGTQDPAFPLDVAGAVHASSFPTSSDARFKTNVRNLNGVLQKLAQLHGVSFDWNQRYAALNRSTGHGEIGLIAQEVEEVFPELVTTWGPEQYRAVDYGRMTAILVEGLNELQTEKEAEIAQLRQENAKLEARVAKLEAMVAKLAASQEGDAP